MERERFMSSREWLWLWQWMRVRVCCFWQLVVAPWHLWLPAVVLALFVALSATHSQPHILALLLCWGYLVQYLYILLDHRYVECWCLLACVCVSLTQSLTPLPPSCLCVPLFLSNPIHLPEHSRAPHCGNILITHSV